MNCYHHCLNIGADDQIIFHEFCSTCEILGMDDEGDMGTVWCGKCGKPMHRYEAQLSVHHLYLCNECEE